jgi:DNA-binding transcriptional MerR regulator
MVERSHLSIGEVLSLLREEFPDVTISKIRFLESQGLVDPERTPSGYRKFYEHDVERLSWILRQQREHFLPLKVIRGRLAELGSSFSAAGAPTQASGPAAATALATVTEIDLTTISVVDVTPEEDVSVPAADSAYADSLWAEFAAPPADDPARDGHIHPAPGSAETAEGSPAGADQGEADPDGDEDDPGADVQQSIGGDGKSTEPVPQGRNSSRSARLNRTPSLFADLHREDEPEPGPPVASPGGSAAGRTPQRTETGTSIRRPATRPGAEASARRVDAAREQAVPARPAVARRSDPGPRRSVPEPVRVEPVARRSEPPRKAEAVARRSEAPRRGAEPAPAASSGRRRAAEPLRRDPRPQEPAEEQDENYTTEELAWAADAAEELVVDLRQYGLIAPCGTIAGVAYYDEDALAVAEVAARFARHGVEPRHLRAWRHAAEREADLFQQIVLPLLRQRNPHSRREAADLLDDLAACGADLRAVLVGKAIREIH